MPNFLEPDQYEIGIGPTVELSLRASVATLVNIQFDHPADGRRMLVLERTATLRDIEGRTEVTVKAKPFGGGVRVTNPQELTRLIGSFHYDSERSREETDFRVHIQPESWDKVKGICRDHWEVANKNILDASPERELAEELEDTLQLSISADQYHLKPRWISVEDIPGKTHNVRTEGFPTVRLYYVYEAWIQNSEIIAMMLENSTRYSDQDLQKMGWEDAQRGGKGRANAILVLGLDEVKAAYRSITKERRSGLIQVGQHILDGNVLAILEGVEQTIYNVISE